MADSQKTPPTDINYYADKYWNDLPEVLAYMCKNATGDRNLWWIPYVKQRYAEKPFNRCLIIACGNGWVERQLHDNGIALEFDAFDCMDTSLDQARQQKGDRPINYFKSSFADLRLEKKYDLIVNVGALHHVDCLDHLLEKLAAAMPPEGLFVNFDYIGPIRNQYTNEQLKLMTEVNDSLPPKFRTKHILRHEVDVFIKGDITEAVRSTEIISTFERYFEMIERRNLGGGIAYQLLWNNIEEFSKDDPEAKMFLQKIIDLDDTHTRNRTVPNLFAFFIGSPRPASRALQEHINNFYRDRLEMQLESQINENSTLVQRLKDLEREREEALMQNVPTTKQESFLQKIRNFFASY